MSESGDGAVVGVVGQRVESARAAVEAAGAEAVTGPPETVLAADPSRIVAIGPESLSELVAEAVPTAPVLPIDAGPGVPALAASDIDAGLDAFLGGDFERVRTPVVEVAVDGDPLARAVSDVMLVTAEPARISEYAVATTERAVGDFRADGVVVATPLGSHGYARRVDGPIVSPGADVAAVVPIAPFATDADHWVLPLSDVELRVARDEHPVELHADHRTVGPVSSGVPVTVSAAGAVELATVPASRPVFAAIDRD